MTPGPFEVDSDLTQWAPQSLRTEIDRALHRGRHLLITGRLGSGRTRAARLARQLLTNTGDTATIVHLGDEVEDNPAGRYIFVGDPGSRPADFTEAPGATLITIHPWAREEVRATVARLGVRREIADRLYAHTGGHLGFLRAWDAAGRPEDLTVPETWQSAVDRALDQLSPEGRHLAEELSCGYGVLVEPIAPLLRTDGDHGALLAELDEVALLGPAGELLPIVVVALERRLPPYRRQWLRRHFLSELTDPHRHRELLVRWALNGQVDSHLSRHLIACADRVRFSDPELALELYVAASADGTHDLPPTIGLAEAALLQNDPTLALRVAEPALTEAAGPIRFRALRVIEDVWIGKGLPHRAAKLNARYAEPDSLITAAASFLVHLRVGDLPAAERAWSKRPSGVATTVDEIGVVAMVDVLRSSTTAGTADNAALDRLCALGHDVSPECRNLTDWVSTVSALTLAASQTDSAQRLLTHLADAADFTGEHQLLLAWTELRAGGLTEAAEWQARARSRERELTPRAEQLAVGLDLALAQRRNDRAMLAEVWPAAVLATSRCEPDLFGLTIYPDLVMAAARLRESSTLEQLWSDAQALLARLGHPPIWSNLLDWARIQAAIVTSEPEQLKLPAQRLAQAAKHSRQGAVLASAGRIWMDVLAKSFDAQEVITAAQDLATVGLPGDGARLSSHAAARCDDPVPRRDLLDTARLLNPGIAGNGGSARTHTNLQLSEREIEVATLVLRQHSYREIGEALYLSPRTVENHMARIRRRSGARSRGDLLDQLRQALRDLGELG